MATANIEIRNVAEWRIPGWTIAAELVATYTDGRPHGFGIQLNLRDGQKFRVKDAGEIARIVSYCEANGIPITPRARAGLRLEGGSRTRAGLVRRVGHLAQRRKICSR